MDESFSHGGKVPDQTDVKASNLIIDITPRSVNEESPSNVAADQANHETKPGEKIHILSKNFDQEAGKISESINQFITRNIDEEFFPDVVDARQANREALTQARLRKQLEREARLKQDEMVLKAFQAEGQPKPPEFNMAAAPRQTAQHDRKVAHPGKFAESVENWRQRVAHVGDVAKKGALITLGVAGVGLGIATWNLFIELLKLGWDVTIKQGLMAEAGLGGGKR